MGITDIQFKYDLAELGYAYYKEEFHGYGADYCFKRNDEGEVLRYHIFGDSMCTTRRLVLERLRIINASQYLSGTAVTLDELAWELNVPHSLLDAMLGELGIDNCRWCGNWKYIYEVDGDGYCKECSTCLSSYK